MTAEGHPGPVEVDLAIVGAGPSGLYGAYYAGFRGLRVAVLDSLPEPGGQVAALYPEKPIYDIAGLPAVRGRDLISALLEQSAPFEPRYLLGDQVTTLTEAGSIFVLGTARGRQIRCRALLVTGGIGTFNPRPLPEGEPFVDRGLMYFVPSLQALANQDVLVVGGGDSAFDWALALEPLARSVTLVHRRAAFRAHQHTVDSVLASSVRVAAPAHVERFHGNDRLAAVDIRHLTEDRTETLSVQAVVAALGFTADLGPLTSWGIAIRNRHIVVDSRMRTSRVGIYAAGDITEYDGKVRLISVGFGEAATAINNAVTYLEPDADLFPGHSSDAAPPVSMASRA